MPAHTTHAKKMCREIRHIFPKISRTPISSALENFLSHNPTHFPKNPSRTNLIHPRKFYIAISDTFSQKSIAHESNLLI
jgi:hypothetical protein